MVRFPVFSSLNSHESSFLLELAHRPDLALFPNIDTSSPRSVPVAIFAPIQRDADLLIAHLALCQVASWAEAGRLSVIWRILAHHLVAHNERQAYCAFHRTTIDFDPLNAI